MRARSRFKRDNLENDFYQDMYLEKLEIQGFKSFASKNVLVFPGMLDASRRGITAIVGPNGSGKSNTADAIRWVLGEQSMKTLRGKKSEDIIFSGSDKKGKLGMAEVSMYLNNEDKQAPIDYSELVITRRIYRNGESEYLLNNNRVRLSDIQMLLAKSKFGQKTYSVIGQGMVEGFLNTSMAERKEFFDEATGVKQYQIKRDDSLNKLRSSYENLMQAQMLVTEIEPRLKSLTRQVTKLQKRGELETELRGLQFGYYSQLWHYNHDNFARYNQEYLELEKVKLGKEKKLSGLNADLERMEVEGAGDNEFDRLQADLSREQNKKNELNRRLARIEAQVEIKLEAGGQFDLSFLMGRKESLSKEIETAREEIAAIEKGLDAEEETRRTLEKERAEVNAMINELNRQLVDLSAEEEEDIDLKNELEKILGRLRDIDLVEDIEKIKDLIRGIEAEIRGVLDGSPTADKGGKQEKWLAVHGEIKSLTDQKEGVSTALGELNINVSSRKERARMLRERIDGIAREISSIGEKMKKSEGKVNLDDLEKEKLAVLGEMDALEAVIAGVKGDINRISAREEEKRSKLFALQREIQHLQREINELGNKLNDLRIHSTRFETKLEDLEAEIREELGGLKEIRDAKSGEEIDLDERKEKINNLKRQLELIGGIDPQVEQEYTETKDRYDFLSGQIKDFTETVAALEKIIKELDSTIREQFDKEFKVIADNFENILRCFSMAAMPK
jgi:chromosome segregation protein